MIYNKKGFSTISIIVMSIVFIGILFCGLVFFFAIKPAFDKYTEEVRISQTQMKLAILDSTLKNYQFMIHEYPSYLLELISGPYDPKLQRRWTSSLVSQDELNDAWGHPFEYVVNPPGADPPYYLLSRGPKGEDVIFSPVSE